jgi:hypothetical protein
MIQIFHLQSRRRRLYILPKCWCLCIRLDIVTSQKTCATVKGNVNLSIMKKYRCQWCISALILNRGTRRRWAASFMLWFTYPQRMSLECPFNRRLGGVQSWWGWFLRRENLLRMREFKPWTAQPIASKSLYWLATVAHHSSLWKPQISCGFITLVYVQVNPPTICHLSNINTWYNVQKYFPQISDLQVKK